MELAIAMLVGYVPFVLWMFKQARGDFKSKNRKVRK